MIKSNLLFIFILFFSVNAISQRSNVANINTNALWNKMPEKATADSILNEKQTEYANYYAELLKKYEKDLYAYNNSNSNGLIKKQKEEDLAKQQNSITEYTVRAEQEIIKYKKELYLPIKTKMQKAIDEVATNLKYDYVLDTSFGNIIFVKNEKDNILEEVLKYLNLD